jgi:hypothetical protein
MAVVSDVSQQANPTSRIAAFDASCGGSPAAPAPADMNHHVNTIGEPDHANQHRQDHGLKALSAIPKIRTTPSSKTPRPSELTPRQ